VIQFQRRVEGTVMPVRVQPGASRNGIRGVRAGSLHVCVTQSAEKGRANQAVRDLLAKALRIRKSRIDLLAGRSSRDKQFLFHGLAESELASRIAAACPEVTDGRGPESPKTRRP
jgi:uncharacterized protein YggU (UPF0235/DUF167 family)